MATILLVEDSEVSRRALVRLLEREGHRVIVAENGWQGLGAMETEEVDLVVLDWKLPGMDGVHFLRDKAWEERWRTVPVIVVSGEAACRGAWEGGRIRDWMEKGRISGEEVVERVKRVLVGVN